MMDQEKKQQHEETLFPVFRFDLQNRLIYANAPALPLMKYLNCSLNERIPGKVISQYPELFHAALSHKPMDLTIQFNNYSISFSIVPFPEAHYIGMYAYSMQVNENYTHKTIAEKISVLQ